MPWPILHSTATAADVRRVVERVCRERQLITKRLPSNDGLRVLAEQEAQWPELLRRGVQDVEWRLLPSHKGTAVICHPRYRDWYVAAVLGFNLIIALATIAGCKATLAPIAVNAHQRLLAFLLTIALLALFYIPAHLVAAASRTEDLVEALKQGMAQRGILVEPRNAGILLLVTPFLLQCLVVILVAVVGGVNFSAAAGEAIQGPLWADAALLCFVFYLACWLVHILLFSHRGFAQRLAVAQSGLAAATTLLIALVAPVLWAVVLSLDSVSESLTRIQLDQVATDGDRGSLRFVFVATLLVTVFASAIGIHRLTRVPAITTATWSSVQRLHNERHHWTREALASGRTLRLFRAVLGSLIGALLIIDACLVGALCRGTAAALGGDLWSALPSRMLANAEVLLSVVMTGGLDSKASVPSVRLAVLAYTLLVCGVLTVSVGQRVLSRCRLLRCLKRGKQLVTEELGCRIQKLAQRGQCVCPELTVTESDSAFARSWTIGLRSLRFIEVSTSCIELLEDEELDAVLAHELAHHRLGHCSAERVLGVIGRIVCCGDSVMRALEDSFGQEVKADQEAVRHFGADSRALARAIVRLNAFEAASAYRTPSIGACTAGVMEGTSASVLPCSASLGAVGALDGWTLFVAQYTGQVPGAYWHPDVDERVKALGGL